MTTGKLAWRAAGIVLAALWGFAPSLASAQSGDTDAGEVAGLVGASLGGGTKPAFTGSMGVAFSRNGLVMVETSFVPMGTQTIQPWPARSTIDHSLLFDFSTDVHIRIPIKPRWAPYAIVGVGVLWDSIRQHQTGDNGLVVSHTYNQFNAGLNTGGGVRYYVREGWGIRSEVKVIVSKQTYTQMSMGFFYVTGPYWP